MKFITDVREFSGNDKYPEILKMTGNKTKEKSTVIEFLKSFEPIAVMAHGATDYVKSIHIDESVLLFNSDDWFWTNEMIYHFENYDLNLKSDFIKYVLTKIK